MQRPFLPAAIVFLLVWGCAPALVENPASAPLSTDAPSAIAKTTPQVYVFKPTEPSCGKISSLLGDLDLIEKTLALKNGADPESVQTQIGSPPTQPLTSYQSPNENKSSLFWQGEDKNKQYELRIEFLEDKLYARTIGVSMDDGRICIWEATEQSASTMRNAFRIVEDIR